MLRNLPDWIITNIRIMCEYPTLNEINTQCYRQHKHRSNEINANTITKIIQTLCMNNKSWMKNTYKITSNINTAKTQNAKTITKTTQTRCMSN